MEKKKRTLTCIVCPRGCTLEVELEEGAAASVGANLLVGGNLCPRGYRYAVDECTHPMRTVTTTVRTADGGVVPVKTETPIPKEQMLACMKAINAVMVALPIHVGDVILEDVCGARIVATADRL